MSISKRPDRPIHLVPLPLLSLLPLSTAFSTARNSLTPAGHLARADGSISHLGSLPSPRSSSGFQVMSRDPVFFVRLDTLWVGFTGIGRDDLASGRGGRSSTLGSGTLLLGVKVVHEVAQSSQSSEEDDVHEETTIRGAASRISESCSTFRNESSRYARLKVKPTTLRFYYRNGRVHRDESVSILLYVLQIGPDSQTHIPWSESTKSQTMSCC
jgi:hypothetical protein